MGDNHYNKYGNEFQPPHYQVKSNVSSSNGANQQFSYDMNQGAGYESNTHLSSLSNCVKRLQTQLNQYLTKIIDEGSDGTTNYNLGSGEVLNSHLMEQYSTPNTASAFQPESPMNNGGYSYYSNYPPNYPTYQPPPQAAAYPGPDYYNQQYANFQEPKAKKQKNK